MIYIILAGSVLLNGYLGYLVFVLRRASLAHRIRQQVADFIRYSQHLGCRQQMLHLQEQAVHFLSFYEAAQRVITSHKTGRAIL